MIALNGRFGNRRRRCHRGGGMKRVWIGVVWLMIFWISTPARAEEHWVISPEVGFGYDDNVGNSERKADIESDTLGVFGLRADRLKRLSEQTAALFRGSL